MSRRVLILGLLGLVLAGGAIVLLRGGAGRPADYRIDAVFDDARGLVPGQLVEIAGGRVGTIKAVTLTAGYKARVQMAVDHRFAPFRADAACTIRPQGLIAENYVQCNPGTAHAAALRAAGGTAPTVAVAHTTEPVNLTDLFAIWNVPTSQRLTVLLDELGLATAARGEDLNALLRRANPALGQARHLIAMLERQRGQLAQALDDSGTVLASLGPHAQGTRRLIASAGRVLARTGDDAGELATGVHRLPAMLTAARPTLALLDRVVDAGTPLLDELRRSAPALAAVSDDVGPLAAAARTTLPRLGRVLDRGAGVVHRAVPVSRVLATYAHRSLPSAKLAGRLLGNLRDRGFIENLLSFFYNSSLATARYDGTSHILPAHIGITPCGLYASAPVAGCKPGTAGQETTPVPGHRRTYGRTARTVAHPRHRHPHSHRHASAPAHTSSPTQPAPAAPSASPTPATPAIPPLPKAPDPSGGAVDQLLHYLLG